jgi:flagellar hook-length control protein FliK
MLPAAPAMPESPGTSTAGSTATTSATLAPAPGTRTPGTPAFDAILMLQNLAATPECLETDVSETDLSGLGESGDDEDDAEELEVSLAFLAQLLTVTSSRQGHGAQDFETGGQSSGDAQESLDAQERIVSTRPAEIALPAAASDSPPAGNGDGEAMLTAVRPEPLETRAAGDAPQTLARAAEILSTTTRSAGDLEKSTLTTPARDPRWADELGARVSLMIRARESTASLQLTPVDLGPVEVNVTVKDSQATVHFGASQADTRALLEAAMPRLREMLAAQGFQLTDSSVSSGFARSQGQETRGETRAGAEAETSTTESRVVRSLGLLDLYA